MKTFTAGIVQWSPVVHDADAGADKAVEGIAQAAGEGAVLIVFPELWLQGYPYWAASEVQGRTFQAFRAALFKSAISIPGPQMERIQKAAAKHKCFVVMGAHEREGGTLYNSQIFIGDDGALLGRHRKLMPTTTERLVHGLGDGSDLDVYRTPLGKLGGLICYEHQMAPARYALCGLGVQLHASQWPGHAFLDPIVDASTRHLAFENGCFVLVAREIMRQDLVPAGMPSDRGSAQLWETHGGSAIIGPTGKYITGPVFDKETIVTGEIDLDEIAFAKWWVDGTGHYARPDVFRLHWDRRPKPAIEIAEGGEESEDERAD